MPRQLFEFEGPRLLRAEESSASRHLAWRSFGFGNPDEPEEDTEQEDYAFNGTTYVMAHQGNLVSQIDIFHHTIQVPDGIIRLGSIGGVCTDPDYRGLGLASRILDYCALQLRQEGANLMLISGDRGLYNRVGCVPAGKYIAHHLQPEMIFPAKNHVNIRPITSADTDLCHQLYQADTVHFERTADTFYRHLGSPGSYTHANQWLVEEAGQAVAYLLLGVAWEDMGKPENRRRSIREYAGNRVALAGALPLILSHPETGELIWPVPWQDQELIDLLAEVGCQRETITLPDHTLRILNFPGLMADLQQYQQKHLAGIKQEGLRFEQTGPLLSAHGDDRFMISQGESYLALNGAHMTGMVMGGLEETAITQQIASSGLQNLISALYPLPSFFPGLDYH
jgi:predicted N-acetyltransferase YhbS